MMVFPGDLPISVYQVRQWLNTLFIFFRDFRVVRG